MLGGNNMTSGIYQRKPFSEEHKMNIRKSRLDILHTKEHKEKIRNSMKGKNTKESNPERCKKLSNSIMGHIVKNETKLKIKKKCQNAIVVHHINGNHFDNKPENLLITNPREHALIHLNQGDIKPYGGGTKGGLI